ncbi:MAG: pirin family protein [Proteobacteria bacterium]|nr:pirin family protein [Pseudomonadota bacterium]
MMIVRKSEDRGHAEHGWLESYHSFSFAGYHDPLQMGWGPLRVINEDRVQPGKGFGLHGHEDMEIISYVLQGELAHRDSMGNGTVIKPGDVQRMSAGTGIKHSEFNPSDREPVHFLQIWIEPNQHGLEPSYEQKFFEPESKKDQFRLIASSDGRDESVLIHQAADVYSSLLSAGKSLSFLTTAGRLAYLHLVQGELDVNGIVVKAGDAIKVDLEQELNIDAQQDSEFLLFAFG